MTVTRGRGWDFTTPNFNVPKWGVLSYAGPSALSLVVSQVEHLVESRMLFRFGLL